MTLITVSVISRHGVSLEQRSCKPLVNAAFVRNQRYPFTNSSPLFFFFVSLEVERKKNISLETTRFQGLTTLKFREGRGGRAVERERGFFLLTVCAGTER